MKALVVKESMEGGSFVRVIEERGLDSLPAHDVLIRVHYAALNYKDALSGHGHRGITRVYPHTPGVDASGIVVEDRSGTFREGDAVICTSYDLGMNTSGGFAEYIRVPVDWIVPLPQGLDLYQSMVLGTAAFTAALALHKMEKCGQHPSMGEVVVTGATGGVGSMSIALLRAAGYSPVASTGSEELKDWLLSIGAERVIGRSEVNDSSGRPLLRTQWGGGIDNVGGNTLVTLLKACAKEGSVASVGLVGKPTFDMTVYPFILNGVNLLGVDSAETPLALRKQLWNNLADTWKFPLPEGTHRTVPIEEIPLEMEKMMAGKTKGRVVAKLYEK
jgi:acrylyl-CoA reductase (NADPH)